MKNKRKRLTVKITLLATLSGRGGGRIKRKWRIKKRVPSPGVDIKTVKRRISRMARYMGLLLLIVCLAPTAGCARAGGYTEPEELAVVAAIGVDPTPRGVRVSLQTVGQDGKGETVYDEGEGVDFALSRILSGGEGRYELSHCALMVLGDGLSEKTVSEMFELCEGGHGVSDAVAWVGSHSALELLSLEGAVGYSVAGAMRSHPYGAGLFSKNRFYEIKSEALTANGESVMALPYFCVSDGRCSIQGVKLYPSEGERVLLDRAEGAVYLMMRGIFKAGTVEYRDGDRIKTAPLSSCVRRLDEENKRVTVTLFPKERMTESETVSLEADCERVARELYASLCGVFGDPFGLGREEYTFDFRVEKAG